MNILFLLTQDLESPAAIGRYFPLAKAMVQRGHRVKIVGLHSDFQSIKVKRIEKDGVEIEYVAQMHIRKKNNRKYYFPVYQLLPLVVIATWKLFLSTLYFPADIIHVGKPHPMNGLAGLLSKWLKKVPMVVDCDDYESANNRFRGKWQKRIVSYFEKLIIVSADRITTHSHVLIEHYHALGVSKSQIMYLPHVIDKVRFERVNEQRLNYLRHKLALIKKRTVVFVGTISLVSHAVDTLIEAFALVRQKIPDAKLVLVGGGEDFDNVVRLASRLGINEDICFCGKIHPDDVPLYYRLGNVSVDPVKNNEAGQFSLSIKMFETWASQVPLITTDVGDRRIVLGVPQSGILVPPDNPEELAIAITRLLLFPEECEHLVKLGSKHIKNFYATHLASLLEETYVKVIGDE